MWHSQTIEGHSRSLRELKGGEDRFALSAAAIVLVFKERMMISPTLIHKAVNLELFLFKNEISRTMYKIRPVVNDGSGHILHMAGIFERHQFAAIFRAQFCRDASQSKSEENGEKSIDTHGCRI